MRITKAAISGLAIALAYVASPAIAQTTATAPTAAAKVDHFIEHDLGEAFHFGGAVTDFTDNADVGGGDRRLEAGDAAFEFLQDVAHDRENVKSRV